MSLDGNSSSGEDNSALSSGLDRGPLLTPAFIPMIRQNDMAIVQNDLQQSRQQQRGNPVEQYHASQSRLHDMYPLPTQPLQTAAGEQTDGDKYAEVDRPDGQSRQSVQEPSDVTDTVEQSHQSTAALHDAVDPRRTYNKVCVYQGGRDNASLSHSCPTLPGLSTYARFMLLYTKQQMDATSGSPPPPNLHVAGPAGDYNSFYYTQGRHANTVNGSTTAAMSNRLSG